MKRLLVLLTMLVACAVAPAAAAAATPVAPPARVFVADADAGVAGALPTARIGFGRHYGSGRYSYGRRGYGGGGFGFGRRGHGFFHGLFWGFLLGHWFGGGGFPVFGLFLLGLFAWFALRRRRRSRWNAGY